MKGQLNLFREDVYEYSFLLKPDPKTDKEVKLYKRIVNGFIHLSYENLWSVPHLSLFKWRVSDSMDDFIIQKTTQALKDIAEFSVKLDGLEIYHHGPGRKSLVLKVKNAEPIRRVNTCLANEFKFASRKLSPYITIVLSIPVQEFNKLSYTLSQFDYKGEFMCNKITILKKMLGGDKNYVVLHEADLN